MNPSFFIAWRQYRYTGKSKLTSSVSRIAVFGIALCAAVMILSIAIVTGFKKEIRNKVIGFGGHIQISNYDSNNSYETTPIRNQPEFIKELKVLPGVKNIQQYAYKAGILKTSTEFQGVVLKGIGPEFDWSFFGQNMIQGQTFLVNDSIRSNLVLVSTTIARMLNLEVGDTVGMYFIQDPPRVRKLIISGIYETSFEELDKVYVLCDIGQIRKLNNWDDNQVSGLEMLVNDYDILPEVFLRTNEIVGAGLSEDGSVLKVESIWDLYPQVFDWLKLQDINVLIIIILMLAVAGFNMIAGILVLVLEKTNEIGLLKAFGANNLLIKKVFLWHSAFILIKGLFWGNLIGILLVFFQMRTHFLKLDQASYYISYVPAEIQWQPVLILNLGILVTVITILLIPLAVISKFKPAETIRYN